MTAKEKRELKEQAKFELTQRLVPCPEGDRHTYLSEVHCLVTTVARSGMSRRIRFFITYLGEGNVGGNLQPVPAIQEITHWVGQVLGNNVNNDGMQITGCGMDMGFAAVHNLSYYLFGTGNDYALKHRWL